MRGYTSQEPNKKFNGFCVQGCEIPVLEVDAHAYAELFHFPLSAYFSVDGELLVKEIADAEELSMLLVENNGWPTDSPVRRVAASEPKVFFYSDTLSARLEVQEQWKFDDERPDPAPLYNNYFLVKEDGKWLCTNLTFAIMAKN